ncbi:MAG: hypothetical protein Q7J16_09030 [Candidatus Cloacimonadales bacterium]|nr:hypothetical protein [Candidatus Cloacimonadales bacterium]
MKNILILFAITILVAGCILPVKYYKAHSLYMESSYRNAIPIYDVYIKSAPNSAQRIQAEIERSDCYYQLGYTEFNNKNRQNASTLFYLANSPIADSKLDDCYFNLALESLVCGDTIQALNYFNQLLTELPAADKVPEMLSFRIKIFLEQDRRTLAFDDYNQLLQNFPESEFTKDILPEIEKLIPILLSDALTLKEERKYNDALQILLKIMPYPTSFTGDIKVEISDVYRLLAEEAIRNNELPGAKQYFTEAIKYDASREHDIQTRIEEVCTSILKRGDQQLLALHFDEAISIYRNCFYLVQDYPKSLKAIELATEKKQNYAKSLELFEKASNLENLRSYKEALSYYRQAAEYYPSEAISEKIFIMQNLLASQTDPKAFAKTIIMDFKKGALVNAVESIERDMSNKYGSYVKSSDWKATFSIGQYKYEVRYDILSPDENYYFAWTVDIRTKKVVPSNKVTEKMMLDANLLKSEDLKK